MQGFDSWRAANNANSRHAHEYATTAISHSSTIRWRRAERKRLRFDRCTRVTGNRCSECRADRTDENLITRPRVEPKAAYREPAPGYLRERPALQFAVAAIGP